MTKRLFGLVLTVIAIFSLWGCENKNSKKPEEKTSRKTELEVYASQGEKENLNLLVEEYENMNPNVSININLFPESEYTQQMMRIKDQKIAADCIFFPDAGEAEIWKNKKILRDIHKWYADTDEARYYKKWYKNMDADGEYYMIPYRMGKMCVYYNKTLFDSLNVSYPKQGWTWEDYKQTAGSLTGWSDNKRIYGTLGFAVPGSWWMLPAKIRGASDPFREEDLKLYRDSAEWCRAFTYELTENFPYFDWTGRDWGRYDRLFLEGRLGMYFGEDSEANVLNREIEEQQTSITYDVAEMPLWDGNGNTHIYNTAVISMAEATKHPEETYRFMKFCSGERGAKILAGNSTIPAWQSSLVKETYLNSTKIPIHRELFLRDEDKPPAETAVGVLHNAGVEAMENEVTLYMLGEQELNYTFEEIEKKLEALQKE